MNWTCSNAWLGLFGREWQHRENTLKAVGMARTYDLLQKLDAQVYEACKGL